MKNRYPGICINCGQTVQPEQGDLIKKGDRWLVRHTECPEITSGLGIGGYGSDDYNIWTETPLSYSGTGHKRTNGGGQLWEPCPRCGEQPVHLDCGYCDRHCRC